MQRRRQAGPGRLFQRDFVNLFIRFRARQALLVPGFQAGLGFLRFLEPLYFVELNGFVSLLLAVLLDVLAYV